MKQKFVTPLLTSFGRLENITASLPRNYGSGDPEDREFEEEFEEVGDDFESINVIDNDFDGDED